MSDDLVGTPRWHPGDHSGFIFAIWVIVYFGKFLITNVAQILGSIFYGNGFALIFDKNGLGNILGAFFTYSSGRPGLH
jgi:hypothetical protein